MLSSPDGKRVFKWFCILNRPAECVSVGNKIVKKTLLIKCAISSRSSISVMIFLQGLDFSMKH